MPSTQCTTMTKKARSTRGGLFQTTKGRAWNMPIHQKQCITHYTPMIISTSLYRKVGTPHIQGGWLHARDHPSNSLVCSWMCMLWGLVPLISLEPGKQLATLQRYGHLWFLQQSLPLDMLQEHRLLYWKTKRRSWRNWKLGIPSLCWFIHGTTAKEKLWILWKKNSFK